MDRKIALGRWRSTYLLVKAKYPVSGSGSRRGDAGKRRIVRETELTRRFTG